MKKLVHLILAVSLILAFSSVSYADGTQIVKFIGREIYAGRVCPDGVCGALFIGKFFNDDFTEILGRFTMILDHNNLNIERCNYDTQLLRIKLIMNFYPFGRLVLVGPTEGEVFAEWDFDDPRTECVDGNCPLIDVEDYLYYLDLFNLLPEPNLLSGPVECDDDESGGQANKSFIAEVSTEFDLTRQWFGSYWTIFTGGSIKEGYLVHTPIISPAIFGTLQLW